jgi:formylglycine-generating enzyme required for sulfatase activity
MTSKPKSIADRLFSQLLLPALLCLLLAMITLQPAHAARQALVIGNDNYTSVAKLQKAGNDATAMARELKAAGFAVQLHRDLNYRAMVRAVENFAGGIKGGDEVVVFFAGHGVQIKNGGYLLPTDIEATSESEVEKTAYELNALTDKLSEAKAAFSLVMVDACRDNPLKTRGRSVGNTRGLSAIEPPKGQMVVYSASKGQQALDRLNDKDANPNSVFTREFIARMKRPGVKIEELVREVQDAVEALAGTIQHEQRPAIYNEARGNFYFFGPTTVQVAPPVAVRPEPVAPSPRPGQVAGLSLADLEREESTRKEWAAWQAKMKADFDKTAQFTGGADLQVKAWERFLLAWAQDNPQSQEDEGLRELAQVRLAGVRQAALQPARPVAQSISVMAGQTIKDCADCPEMVMIPAGSFEMGSPDVEKHRASDGSEGPIHKVTIGYSFALGKHELTRGEFARFVSASSYKTEAERSQGCRAWDGKAWTYNSSKNWRNPGFTQADNHPVVCVSWNDAQAYLAWLNEKVPGKAFRLPSEAEWEYAARAGQGAKRFPWGDYLNDSQICSFANGMDATGKAKVPGETWTAASCSDGYAYTAPSGSFKANAFGLYDMHGNAWEWVQDNWHENYKGAPADGSAWVSGGDQARRVLRGGAWYNYPGDLRSAIRDHIAPDIRFNFNGLRIARTL